MVGIWGVAGTDVAPRQALDDIDTFFCWIGDESVSRYEGEFRLHLISHQQEGSKPVAIVGDTVIAIWGQVFGHRGPDGYQPRSPTSTASSTEFVASLYSNYGTDAFERLNGEYIVVTYDHKANTLTFVTDHVGSQPLFYTDLGDAIVFSSNLQIFPSYPGVETEFDGNYLTEYLVRRVVSGARTPLDGIHQVAPATHHRFDIDSGQESTSTYWQPTYTPEKRSYDEFVTKFTDLLVQILRERTHPDLHYGVLLSGGGDSRLILAILDELDRTVTAYHANEWENPEAAIARRSATLVDVPFQFLERDRDYQLELLRRNAPLFQFTSTFNQGHFSGFMEELREPDVLLSGKMIEEVLDHHSDFPTRSVNTPLGTAELPLMASISTTDDFAAELAEELPTFVSHEHSLRDIITSDVRETDAGEVVFHGISYPSLESLCVFSELYPLTNDKAYLDYGHLIQFTEHWSAFLDVRLLELAETYPIRYRLRRNIVFDAIEQLNPELATLTNANSGLKGTAPAVAHVGAKQLQMLRYKYFPSETPAPHYSQGSWTNHAELIRSHSFIEDAIERHAELIDAIPALSLDGARECYRAHLDGTHNSVWPLYALVSLLEAPVSHQVAGQAIKPVSDG